MSTTTIKNAPKSFGKEIDYDEYIILKKKRFKRPGDLISCFYDKKTDSYGPFEGEDAINFLKLLRNED